MPLHWEYDTNLQNYEVLLLYNALRKHPDAYHYKPIAIAKREETGIKYHFLCIAVPKDNPFRPSHFTDIEVYKPPLGAPYITLLKRIEFDCILPNRMPVL